MIASQKARFFSIKSNLRSLRATFGVPLTPDRSIGRLSASAKARFQK